MEVHVLASGSQGNATAITFGNRAILIDAGISARRITNGLKEVGIGPHQLDAVLITHEHTDHISGLPQLVKQYDIPIITREKTAKEICYKKDMDMSRFHCITNQVNLLSGLAIDVFSTSHDAIDPIGVSVTDGTHKATVLTDTGIVDERMMGYMEESDILVLEANYDEQMLRYGPYPLELKRRVGGQKGHLSNDVALDTLLSMKRPKELDVVFAHRSEKNNALPIVDLLAKRLALRIDNEWGQRVHIYHGDPKQAVSVVRKETI